MKIAFTICSNNYLAQAKTLGDSLLELNADYSFYIFLCDKKNDNIDYSFFKPHHIITVEDIGIVNLDWMIYNYNIVEFNTAIKPFAFIFLSNQHSEVEYIMYFDPDIKVYNNLSCVERELEGKSILLTPHILTPIPLDEKMPSENTFLNYGIYNLGFIAIRPDINSKQMLLWWAARLSFHGFNRVKDGYFVDQLPMNLVPIFFEGVIISTNVGLNFAYWNFHERTLGKNNDIYMVNENNPLIFFHFSSFDPLEPYTISSYQTRFTMVENSLLNSLFSDYSKLLLQNNFLICKNIQCYYVLKRQEYMRNKRKEDIKKFSYIKKAIILIYRKIRSIFE